MLNQSERSVNAVMDGNLVTVSEWIAPLAPTEVYEGISTHVESCVGMPPLAPGMKVYSVWWGRM